MISNNLTLSSQKLNTIVIRRKNLKRFISQPNQLRHHKLEIKIKESQDNLFNFIKDSIV